ncbi:hypothetical protein LCGC14_1793490 [marine sediment metagenome]|uniref:Uncharacterized protein n=1 Tax=marine sediment metagenome TaxID=412755 RepID=A0A0F9J6K8_9ZZZZ|nr:hypothetical protein [Spirochaetota bacterium]
MNSAEFRKQLIKIMPGYKWTVHRALARDTCLMATGIQSSGFNRLSTLYVRRNEQDGTMKYKVETSGYGRNSACLSTNVGGTLSRALRGLQDYYEGMAATYSGHADALRTGRKQKIAERDG